MRDIIEASFDAKKTVVAQSRASNELRNLRLRPPGGSRLGERRQGPSVRGHRRTQAIRGWPGPSVDGPEHFKWFPIWGWSGARGLGACYAQEDQKAD